MDSTEMLWEEALPGWWQGSEVQSWGTLMATLHSFHRGWRSHGFILGPHSRKDPDPGAVPPNPEIKTETHTLGLGPSASEMPHSQLALTSGQEWQTSFSRGQMRQGGGEGSCTGSLVASSGCVQSLEGQEKTQWGPWPHPLQPTHGKMLLCSQPPQTHSSRWNVGAREA